MSDYRSSTDVQTTPLNYRLDLAAIRKAAHGYNNPDVRLNLSCLEMYGSLAPGTSLITAQKSNKHKKIIFGNNSPGFNKKDLASIATLGCGNSIGVSSNHLGMRSVVLCFMIAAEGGITKIVTKEDDDSELFGIDICYDPNDKEVPVKVSTGSSLVDESSESYYKNHLGNEKGTIFIVPYCDEMQKGDFTDKDWNIFKASLIKFVNPKQCRGNLCIKFMEDNKKDEIVDEPPYRYDNLADTYDFVLPPYHEYIGFNQTTSRVNIKHDLSSTNKNTKLKVTINFIRSNGDEEPKEMFEGLCTTSCGASASKPFGIDLICDGHIINRDVIPTIPGLYTKI